MSDNQAFVGIKGLGAKRIEALRNAGINSVTDLLSLLPKAYYDTSQIISAADCRDSEACALKGRVVSKPLVRYVRKGFSLTTITMECELGGGAFRAVFFNRPYLSWSVGEIRYFFGTASVSRNGSVTVSNPVVCADGDLTIGGILCVYPKVKDIPANVLKEAVKSALKVHRTHSIIPSDIAAKFGLEDITNAYKILHEPMKMEQVYQASSAAATEELVRRMVMFYITKSKAKPRYFEYSADMDALMDKLSRALPFCLNDGQVTAIKEIIDDLKSPRLLNRLLMGDVGSGKSVVAYAAMVYAAMSGFQSVIMSPTEILARQHMANLSRLFPDIRLEFLSSSQNVAAKRAALFNIASGAAEIIVGTHAVIQKDVEFRDLRLAVTDELHRFGVAQRSALEDKGGGVDSLLLSATPIPRSLALVMYGDLNISRLESRAGGTSCVTTSIVPSHKLNDMYAYIRSRAEKGAVTYVVCPRVEEGEGELEIESVKDIYAKLTQGVLRGVKVGLLHGKMKDAEKASVIDSVMRGEIKVLVATTVIEVGVDVKDAENIVIFNADRYGLAQLHQLRGRVGRQGQKAYCFLLTESKNPDSLKRLDVLKNNNDGFLLSEHDLESRGAGDFLGTAQHGFAGAGLINKGIIDLAKEVTSEIIRKMEANPDGTAIDERLAKLIHNVTLN